MSQTAQKQHCRVLLGPFHVCLTRFLRCNLAVIPDVVCRAAISPQLPTAPAPLPLDLWALTDGSTLTFLRPTLHRDSRHSAHAAHARTSSALRPSALATSTEDDDLDLTRGCSERGSDGKATFCQDPSQGHRKEKTINRPTSSSCLVRGENQEDTHTHTERHTDPHGPRGIEHVTDRNGPKRNHMSRLAELPRMRLQRSQSRFGLRLCCPKQWHGLVVSIAHI